MYIKTLLTNVLCLLSIIQLTAQNYFFYKYTSREGLTSSTIYSIVQDNKDYLWLGTADGIFRFNGSEFYNFNSENNGLASNQVKSLLKHTDGTLWLGHWNGGLTHFDGENFTVVMPANKSAKYDVKKLIEDYDKSIWYITNNGLYHITNPQNDSSQLALKHYKGGTVGSFILDINLTTDSTLITNTEFGIATFNRDSDKFERIVFKGTQYAIKNCFLEDRIGYYWFGTRNDGLFKFNPSKNNFAHYDIKDGLETNIVTDLYQDSRGYVWAINFDERNIKGGATAILGSRVLTFNKKNGLPDNRVHCIYEDKEGNVLIGTKDNGLAVFKGLQFRIFVKQDVTNNVGGLINDQVYAITEDQYQNIWLGTEGGLTRYNPEKLSFTHYNSENYGINNKIRFISPGLQNNLWVGTAGGGLYNYNHAFDKFNYVYLKTFNEAADYIVTAMCLHNDNLWVGTNLGLAKYNTKTETETSILKARGYPGLSDNVISAIAKQGERLWVGAQNAGLCYSDDDNTFHPLDSLKDVTPNCIYINTKEEIMIGTNTGLFVLNSNLKNYRNITTRDGLLSNRVLFINEDDEGNFYIGTQLGMNKIHSNSNVITTFNEYNGYVGIESKPNATFKDSKGNIWMGTAEAAIQYIPNYHSPVETDPSILISDVYVNRQRVNFFDDMKLKYKQNQIYINYTSINTTNPKAVRYRIQLEGYNKNWQDVTTNRSANYESLPPGKYTFKVKAKNSYGKWNENPKEFSFTIKPPFYRTWWFITLMVFIIGGSILAYIRIRTQNLIKEKKVLEEKVKERTIELSDANAELAMKNKDITDSIQYARRIQFAILPPKVPFENTFVLFKPKDIVSGDFYWINIKDDKEFIAAVDCTGHGVPGAFMSFIGYTSLNKIVMERGITEPAKILDELDHEVVNALHQGNEQDVKDGMDMSIICYDRKQNKLEFAGAYNGVYQVRNGELIDHKVNRFAIGRSHTEDKKEFTNFTIDLQPGDVIYQYSDGYADQFGGPNGKKFRARPFKELLVKIAGKPADEQQQILDNTIEQWRDDIEQIDDILVIGRKF